jgi:hypothetical protein
VVALAQAKAGLEHGVVLGEVVLIVPLLQVLLRVMLEIRQQPLHLKVMLEEILVICPQLMQAAVVVAAQAG